MKTKTTFLPLLALLAGAFVLAPASALAERNGERHRDRQHQSLSNQQKERHAAETKAPRAERKSPQRVERQQPRSERRAQGRIEQQRQPQHVERRTPQRAGRQYTDRTEQKSPQHAERREERRPAVVQRNTYEKRHAERSGHRRYVETRRTFHIERPQHIQRRNYRHVPRQRYYRGIHVHRRYGHLYPGFGFYYSDNDALQWIAFTVLTLAIIDHLDEHQQRLHEQAQIRATSADIGDTIYWRDRRSSGSITVTDIWYDRRGRECRELEQSVTARGRTESSFGTVCQNRNGAWVVARN